MRPGPVAIILAAGHGKRMKSERAKVLHEVCGQPMIRYVVEAARGAGARTIVVVVGFGADQVRASLADEPDVLFATQTRQLGTGDAVKACRPLLEGYRGAGAGPGRRRAPAPPRAAGRPAGPPAGRGGRLPARYRGPPRPDRLRPHPPRLRGPLPPDRRGARLQPRGEADPRGQPELLRLRPARPLGRARPAHHEQRPGRVLPDRRPRPAPGDGPQGRRPRGARARRHPRRQHAAAPGPGARHHAGQDPGPLDDRGGQHRRPPEHLHRRPRRDRPRHGDLPVLGDHRAGQGRVGLPDRPVHPPPRRHGPGRRGRGGRVRRGEPLAPGVRRPGAAPGLSRRRPASDRMSTSARGRSRPTSTAGRRGRPRSAPAR